MSFATPAIAVTKSFNIPYAESSLKLNLDSAPFKVKNSKSNLELRVATSEAVTLMELSSGFDCKTGAIKLSGSIPEVSNFKQAMGLFVPWAVDENGEVSFSDFLEEILLEVVSQELTEGILGYLGYFHYYVTSYLNDRTGTASAQLFNLDSFKACIKSAVANTAQTGLAAGASTAGKDDFHVRVGVDILALFKSYGCIKKSRGPTLVSDSKIEKERFVKSKKIVRALFYKFLNSQFDFSIQPSAICRQYTEAINGALPKNQQSAQDELQFSSSTEYKSSGGNSTITGVSYKKNTILLPSAESIKLTDDKPEEGGTDEGTKDTESKSQANEAKSATKAGKATKQGSRKTKQQFDFQTTVRFRDTPHRIDFLDLPPIERAILYKETLDDFLEKIDEAPYFIPLSSNSKAIAKVFLARLVAIQQINLSNLAQLNCAISSTDCDYNWITEIQYQIMVNNENRTHKCVEAKYINDTKVCVSSVPKEASKIKDIDKDLDIVEATKQQEYMSKLVNKKMESLVESYYRSLGAFVFATDTAPPYNQGVNNATTTTATALGETGASIDVEDVPLPRPLLENGEPDTSPESEENTAEYLKKKITYQKFNSLLNTYWSSPIKSLSAAAISNVEKSLGANSTSGQNPRAQMYEEIAAITKNDCTDESSMSYTPFIYEPANELQMAKLLYQTTADPAIVNKVMHINKDNVLPPMASCKKVVAGAITHPGPDILNLLDVSEDSDKFTTIIDSIKYGKQGQQKEIYMYIMNDNEYRTEYQSLPIEELDSIAKISEKFKDFYIKRLLDVYSQKYQQIRKIILREIGENTHEAALKTYMVDLEAADFKMQQRREMLRLLLY